MKRKETLFKRALSLMLAGVMAVSLCLIVPPAMAEETEGHVHTRACYLLCTEDHVHTDACEFDFTEPVCGLEEGQVHVHNRDGYLCQEILICEREVPETAPVPAETPENTAPETGAAPPVQDEGQEELPSDENNEPEPAPAPEPEPEVQPEPEPAPETPTEPVPDAPEETGEDDQDPETSDEMEEPQEPVEEIEEEEIPTSALPPHECPEEYHDVHYMRCLIDWSDTAMFAAEGTTSVNDWNGLKTAVDAGGTVALTANITGNGQIVIPAGKSVSIDLNGYTLEGTPQNTTTNFIQVAGTLTVEDSVGGGKIVCKNGDNAISVDTGGTLNLNGGTITTESSNRAVFVWGTMNMTGGAITGNNCTGGSGGGIFVKDGTMNMTGGTISGNSARDHGGGIYAKGSGKVNISSDAQIYNNTAHACSTTGKKEGCPSVYMDESAQLIRDTSCVIEGIQGTRPDNSGLQEKFNAGGTVALTENLEMTGKVVVKGSVTLDLSSHIINGNLLKKSDCMFLVSGEGSTLTITGTGTIASTTSELDSIVKVEGGGKLILAGGTLTNTNGYRALTVSKNSTINMTGGKLTGAQSGSSGAGVLVNGGAFTMSGGEICGNTAKSLSYVSGGAIRIADGGAVTISGNASIHDNESITNGGGISILAGTLTIAGGTITNNKAAKDGGGIYASDEGIVNISGGVISNNEAKEKGGAICAVGKLNITGGMVERNHARSGGGVYAAQMKMSDGIITENEAWIGNENVDKCGGGGIYIADVNLIPGDSGYELELTGGTISNNTSVNVGGGILIDKRTDAIISGSTCQVTINGNKANGRHGFSGGGIFVEHPTLDSESDGKLYVYNAVITGNEANYGGGVGGCGDSSVMVFSFDGVAIYGNTIHPERCSEEKDRNREDYLASTDLYCDGKGQVDSMMIGGVQATWNGRTKEGGTEKITITMGVEKLDHFYLKAELGDEEKSQIEKNAAVFITGNTSADGGGGIGGNGYMRLGLKPAEPDNSTLTTGTLTVKKSWNDAGHTDSRPESVTVQLKRNSVNCGEKVTLNEANNWSYNWSNLPVKDTEGNTYTYSIEETVPDKYTVEYSSSSVQLTAGGETKVEITNTYSDDPSVSPPKEDPKDPPKEDPKDPPKEDPKDPPKEDPKDPPKEDPKDPPKEDPKDPPKEDPTDPPKEDPKEPPEENPPEEPQPSEEPVIPAEPEERSEPEYPTELPDPSDPDSPDVITILDEGVPKTYKKIWDPETEQWLYILEDEVPLFGFDVPETGDESWTGLWAALCLTGLTGGAAIAAVSGGKRGKEDEET